VVVECAKQQIKNHNRSHKLSNTHYLLINCCKVNEAHNGTFGNQP
jgi:hypothetical protein